MSGDLDKRAQGWLAERGLADTYAPQLAALLREAVEAALAARDRTVARPADVAGAGATDDAESPRAQEALLARTNKILGREPRSYAMLLEHPHKLRAVAVHANVDPRTVRRFIKGDNLRSAVGDAVTRSLKALGFPTGQPS